MLKKLIVALAAVALIGGCVKMDKSPPKDLPAYVKVMPDATSMVSMNIAGMSSLVFQTTTAPDAVITFYRTQASSDGLQESTAPPAANAPADQKQAVFGDPTSDKMLVVVARPQGSGSMVSLTYKPAAKPAS